MDKVILMDHTRKTSEVRGDASSHLRVVRTQSRARPTVEYTHGSINKHKKMLNQRKCKNGLTQKVSLLSKMETLLSNVTKTGLCLTQKLTFIFISNQDSNHNKIFSQHCFCHLYEGKIRVFPNVKLKI